VTCLLVAFHAQSIQSTDHVEVMHPILDLFAWCRIPEALQPFMPGKLSFIPFRKQLDPKTKKLIPIAK